MDVFFVVDRSCRIENNDEYCGRRGELIAETMSKIKGRDTGNNKNIRMRLGYIEYGADGSEKYLRVDLDSTYNTGGIDRQTIEMYYNDMRYYGCNPRNGFDPTTDHDAKSGIEYSLDRFNYNQRANTPVQKIVVFTDCIITSDICAQDLIDKIYKPQDENKDDIDVIFVNLGEPAITGDQGVCLSQPNDRFNRDLFVDDMQDIVYDLYEAICSKPTNSPTRFFLRKIPYAIAQNVENVFKAY